MDDIEGQAQAATETSLAHAAALRIIEHDEPKAEATVEGDNPPVEKTEPEPQETQAEETTETKEEEAPQPRLHKLKVKAEDGSDSEVEVDDEALKKGFMMEKDYRAKTAQLAREREAVAAKVKEAVEPKVQEYERNLQTFGAVVQNLAASELKDVNWPQLAASDPAEYVRLKARAEQFDATLRGISAEQAKINNVRQQEAQQSLQRQVQESIQVLQDPVKGIPGWSNDVYNKVLQAGIEQGFKQEAVTSITDPVAIKVLWKAMQYDALQKSKPAIEKKVSTVPKVARPGTSEKPDNSAKQSWQDGMRKLQNSRSDRDAMALARMLIE